MGSWVSDRHGSSARRSVSHWCGHHGGCLLDFVCLDYVKCDLWLGRWLICRGGRWLWAVAVDLQVWVVVDGDDRKEIIYYFNV